MKQENLKDASVIVFGVGGVGSYTVEALARAGIGSIAIVDDDKVCLTNINRQLIATRKTVGKEKVDMMKERILDINPNTKVKVFKCFYTADTASEFDFTKYDYIVDAIDTVSSKIVLIEKAKEAGVPVISCMGAGNKLNPSVFEVADIYSTSICPLAKVMRRELKVRGIQSLKVVYSKETPLKPVEDENSCKHNCICPEGTKRKCAVRRQVPGSISYVPSAAGILIAREVVKDLLELK